MAPHRLIVAVVVGAGIVLDAGPATARPCADRYVVVRSASPLVAKGSPLVVTGDRVVLDPTCEPAPARWRTVDGRARVRARWRDCGQATRLRLRLRASADCTLLRGRLTASGRTGRIVATASTCGDGIVDAGRGERCDDGSGIASGCDSRCGTCLDPATLGGTWAAIRANVLDRHCLGCHGANASRGLDLRGPGAYARIAGVAVPGTTFQLLAPGSRLSSLLWLKLAKATLGGFDDLPGAGMPIGPEVPPMTVEAIGRWIDAGAPESGFVPDTDDLLAPCE